MEECVCQHMQVYVLMTGDLEGCYFMHFCVIHKLKFLHRQERISFGLLLYVSFCNHLEQPRKQWLARLSIYTA